MHLHARAGIEDLGPYLSRGRQHIVAKAIADLSKVVDTVSVDYSMERALNDLTAGLIPERDNRSVTDPEWVEKGIATYGCPIHTTTAGQESTFTVSGHGACACRQRSTVRRAGRAGSGRGRRHNQNGNSSNQVALRQGSQRLRSVPDDAREHPWRTPLSLGQVPGESGFVDASGPFRSESYKVAIRSVYDTAGGKGRGTVPKTIDEVVEKDILRNSYAGAPFFRPNRDVLTDGARLARDLVDGRRGFDPYMFGRRIQPGKSGPKTRLIWMAPLPTTIIGTRYSKPVMENLRRRRPFVWGTHGFERAAIISEIECRYRYVYSLDFSKFDSTVPARMIDDAFRVARTHLELTDEELELWRKYVNDFIHSRIIAPDGHVYQKHKGIPSGSAFTSIVGSIVNLILVSYMWHRVTGHSLPHDRVLVMGDDVIIGSNARLTKAQLSSAASELGFVLSVEKTDIVDTSDEVQDFWKRTHFLGYYWLNGQPNRSERELVQRMVYPERHRKRAAHEWVVRLLGYAMTCRQGLEILVRVFPHPDTIQSYLQAADRAKELGWNEDDDVPDVDLPGQLRYRRRVEGESIDLTPSKVTGGIFGRWT